METYSSNTQCPNVLFIYHFCTVKMVKFTFEFEKFWPPSWLDNVGARMNEQNTANIIVTVEKQIKLARLITLLAKHKKYLEIWIMKGNVTWNKDIFCTCIQFKCGASTYIWNTLQI